LIVHSDVKNEWSYTSLSHIRLHGVDRENFTFVYLYLMCRAVYANVMLLMDIKDVEYAVRFADILRRLGYPEITSLFCT
jgi:hypothetical protein